MWLELNNRIVGSRSTIITVIKVHICACVCTLSRSVMSDSLRPHGLAHQAPLSMVLSQQQYWSGLPFLPPRDLPDPRIEPVSPAAPALACGFFTTEPPGSHSHI